MDVGKSGSSLSKDIINVGNSCGLGCFNSSFNERDLGCTGSCSVGSPIIGIISLNSVVTNDVVVGVVHGVGSSSEWGVGISTQVVSHVLSMRVSMLVSVTYIIAESVLASN